MSTTATLSAKIEDIQVGHRYVETIHPSFNDGWRVSSVEHHQSLVTVLRDGEWVPVDLVTVTYRNGQKITAERGETLAIDCDEALTPGSRVEFEVGRRTLVGTLTQPCAQGTKFGIATDEGEYTLPIESITLQS